MKTLLTISLITSLFFTCASIKTNNFLKENMIKDKTVDSIFIGENIKNFFGNQVVNILVEPDSVLFNKVIVIEQLDSISKEKMTHNELTKIGKLDVFSKDVLQFILLSDSTYIWEDISIKHAFEPEMTFVFIKDSSNVNIIYSPNTKEIGFRYKDFFNTIYVKNNDLVNIFFTNILLLKSETDTIKIIKDSTNINTIAN